MLAYSRDLVWNGLNEPALLASCIRGCRYAERESAHRFRAVIQARIAEFRKDFHVDLVVDDSFAPGSYTLTTQMGAGFLGTVSGRAEVRLEQLQGGQTCMFYAADISGIGLVGKLLPLVEARARRRVQEFFDQFVERLGTFPG